MLRLDPATGDTTLLLEQSDDVWVDAVDGVPALLPDGRLVVTADLDDTRRLVVDGEPVTPAGLQVEAVVSVSEDGVLLEATDDPVRRQLWRWTPGIAAERLTDEDGYFTGLHAGGTLVVAERSASRPLPTVVVTSPAARRVVTSYAATPPVVAVADLLPGRRRHELAVGVVLPRDHVPGTPLPVLMDPYGGPHHREVIDDAGALARGAVDRRPRLRGRQGRRPRHRRPRPRLGPRGPGRVRRHPGGPGRRPPRRSPRRCPTSTSPGSASAAGRSAATSRRSPCCAGRTSSTRRWPAPRSPTGRSTTRSTRSGTSGTRRRQPEVYARNSLLDDAARLTRPLLVIHGLADDNVVVAHTLRLSSALVAAGRPHEVLPLSGVTHMTPQDVVEENKLVLQVEWLQRHLGVDPQ